MRHLFLAACLSFGPPAGAEIEPEALWQRWQSGQGTIAAIGGTARQEDGALVIDGAVLRFGEGETASRVRADGLRLEPDADATIVVPPDSWRFEGPDGTIADVTAEGLDIRVSGEIGRPEYRVDEDELAASTVMTAPDSTVDTSLNVVALDFAMSPGRGAALSADRVSMTAAPREEGQGRLSISYDQFDATFEAGTDEAGTANGAMPIFTLSTKAASGAQSFTAPLETGGPPATIDIASGPSRGELVADGGRVEARQTASEIVLSATGESVPLPDARVEVGALTLSVSAPSEPVEDAAPVSLDLGLAGIMPSEQIWQLLDPGADLSRDSAELRLALSGAMSWQTTEDPPIPALERASIDTLRFAALGAEIDGGGSVRFSPPATPDQAGRPLGALAFTLTGLGSLLDKLETLGTVQPGQLLGLRMGLGLFTRPDGNGDVLRSEIEFTQDGTVVVNGAPIARLP
jgi:hypothetical protein